MTLTVIDPVGSFSCKKCKLTFEASYKPQQRPRKSCPSCHKMCGMTVNKKEKTQSTKNLISPQEGVTDGDPLTITLSAEYLEKCLTSALNKHPENPNLLRTAIEFFIKIKGKTDAIDDDLDMEVLKQIGIKITAGD